MCKRFALILILIAFFAAGCGAAAAPPVDLPAPVTGQIDVSPPDASGKSTITGTEGSVTANTIVLAGNEDLTETAMLWNLTEALMPSAHAQTQSSLPEICTTTGYACTISDSNGAFTLLIDAFVGNSIYVVLVDANGNERSPRSEFTVPAYDLSISAAGCTGTSGHGYLVDVKHYGADTLALFEGDGETGKQNILQFGSGSGSHRIDLPGCYAKQLATYPLGEGELLVAVISSTDKIVWSGVMGPNGLIGINTHLVSEYPLSATFVDESSTLLIAMGSGSSYTLEQFVLADGSSSDSLAIPAPSNGDTLNGILGVKVLGPFTDGGYFGTLVSKGVDGSSYPQTYVLFFDAKTLDVLSSSPNQRLGYESVGGGILFPNTARDIADFAVGFDGQTSGRPLILMISDRGNQAAHMVQLRHDAYAVEFDSDTMSELYTDKVFMSYMESTDRILPGSMSSPRRLALGMSSSISMAYILTDEGHIWKLENYPMGNSATQSFPSVSGASDLRAIDLYDSLESIIVGDAAVGDIINADSAWGSGS